jgi:hypothetical protein
MSAGLGGVMGKGRRRALLYTCFVAIGCVAFVSPDFAWYATVPSYSPPRTPWGDPDIQGAFSNTDERGTPMERPDSPGWFNRASNTVRGLTRYTPDPQVPTEVNKWEPTYEGTPRNSRSWLVVDPADGKIPQQAPQLAQRMAAAAAFWRKVGDATPWVSLGPFGRCISRGMPESMMPSFYGNVYDITQAPGTVAIRYEMINETRVIPLDGRPHLGPALHSYMGDPRGRFEGDTLVVDTTNLSGKAPFRGSSEQLRLVERFTPIDANTLEWSVTLDDPATWARPWTFAMSLNRTSVGPLEFACHEGNYAMRHILSIRASAPATRAVQRSEASIVDN